MTLSVDVLTGRTYRKKRLTGYLENGEIQKAQMSTRFMERTSSSNASLISSNDWIGGADTNESVFAAADGSRLRDPLPLTCIVQIPGLRER